MTGDDFAQLVYLGVLAVVIGGYAFASSRQSLTKSIQGLLLWALIFVGVAAGYGLWADIENDRLGTQAVEDDGNIRLVRAGDGHFYAAALVNGVSTRFLVDTGATDLVLSREAAQAAGIDVDKLAFLGTAQTANGVVETAVAEVNTFEFGGFAEEGIRATVNGGELGISLLGQRYLNKFARIEITAQDMTLIR